MFALQQTASFDLAALVGRVVEQYQVTSGNRLSYETGAETLLCLGDAGRIEQVCVNLMSNALKYNPPSSPVAVKVMCEPGSIPVPHALISSRIRGQASGQRPRTRSFAASTGSLGKSKSMSKGWAWVSMSRTKS